MSPPYTIWSLGKFINTTLLYNLIIFNFLLVPYYHYYLHMTQSECFFVFVKIITNWIFFTWIVDSGRKKRPCVARETWCGSIRDNVRWCCTAKAVRISLEKGSLLMRRMSFRMLVIDSTVILLKEVMWTRPFSKEELWYNNKESL